MTLMMIVIDNAHMNYIFGRPT